MFQEVNHYVVIGNGHSKPVGNNVEYLIFLETSYAEMDLINEAHSFGHQTWANKE